MMSVKVCIALCAAKVVSSTSSTESYTEYTSKTAYYGHGGDEIDSESSAPVGLTVSSCEDRCSADSACSCVSFRPSDGKCWKRGNCVPSLFGSDNNFNTYVKSGAPGPNPPGPSGKACLCVFDIDRTLTGKQWDTQNCPANSIQSGVYDDAYDRGDLTLSEVAQGVGGTFCGGCHIGVVSAGDASGSGSAERGVLHDRLAAADSSLPNSWSSGCSGSSPLVASCTDGQKQNAVRGIVAWYAQNEGAQIADSDVHFFDDRSENIEPFRSTGFNAHQIACGKRDKGGSIGYCGAKLSEITAASGVTTCGQALSV